MYWIILQLNSITENDKDVASKGTRLQSSKHIRHELREITKLVNVQLFPVSSAQSTKVVSPSLVSIQQIIAGDALINP